MDRTALREAFSALLWSRLLALFLGLYFWLSLDPAQRVSRPPNDFGNVSSAFDGWPLEGVLEAIFQPMAVWDSRHYIRIAESGYVGGQPSDALFPGTRPAFFPLYPALIRLLSAGAESTGTALIAAYLISVLAFLGALYVLYRLVVLEIGHEVARLALLLLAFSPAAFVFSIPFTESLFTLLTISSVYAARTGHWAVAGILAAAASGTRNTGILLIVPLVLMYLYGPRPDGTRVAARRSRIMPSYRVRRDILWLALTPLGLIVYSLFLLRAVGDAFAWTELQAAFGRQTTGPLLGVWYAVRDGVKSLLGTADGLPGWHALNVLNLLLLMLVAVALVGVFRRLPLPYGAYMVAVLAVLLSAPWSGLPLFAFPRFLLPVFPLFMWLALVCHERKIGAQAVGVSAALFGVLCIQFMYGTLTV
jgi:hypothetical protein